MNVAIKIIGTNSSQANFDGVKQYIKSYFWDEMVYLFYGFIYIFEINRLWLLKNKVLNTLEFRFSTIPKVTVFPGFVNVLYREQLRSQRDIDQGWQQ